MVYELYLNQKLLSKCVCVCVCVCMYTHTHTQLSKPLFKANKEQRMHEEGSIQNILKYLKESF